MKPLENYRGCISEFYYNNIHIFKRAHQKLNHITAFKVAWNCASEFDASMDECISFVDTHAFMMMAKPVITMGETWKLEFKTIESTGGLLYNLGTYKPSDFMGLEILDARLRLLVGKGANAVELITNKPISDGQWHSVLVRYNPHMVEIVVDGEPMQGLFANGSSQIIELGEEFFIGGIDQPLHRRAAMKKFRAADTSFKGCLRNIFVDHEHIGLPTMKITSNVTADCVFDYKCIEQTPCIISSRCEHKDFDDFICHCDQAFCLKAEYTEPYKIYSNSRPGDEFELIKISPMQLLEGESIIISHQFITILFDYNTTSINESDINFHIAQSPKNGRVVRVHGDNSTVKNFNYVDLQTHQIKYIHNGQEQFSDHMSIDMQIKNNYLLLESMAGRHRFLLHANVTPVNDPPALYIPTNQIVRIIQGIPQHISQEILNAYDPDSPSASLIYTIENPSRGNFFKAGNVIKSFTQEDINTGIITFLVNDTKHEDFTFELKMSVSDGMETSAPASLQMTIVPLHLTMINNTGLVLVHKSSAFITPSNLSFVSNSDDENVDIKLV